MLKINHGLEVLLKDETLWMKICNEIWTIIVLAMTILNIKSILLQYCYCSTSYFYVGGLHSFYNVITYQRRWKL